MAQQSPRKILPDSHNLATVRHIARSYTHDFIFTILNLLMHYVLFFARSASLRAPVVYLGELCYLIDTSNRYYFNWETDNERRCVLTGSKNVISTEFIRISMLWNTKRLQTQGFIFMTLLQLNRAALQFASCVSLHTCSAAYGLPFVLCLPFDDHPCMRQLVLRVRRKY